MLNQFIAPGSDEWRQTISASKVPAILGLSPWTSARELYHVMVGDVAPEPGNADTTRGNYLEPAILAWFRDQHPDMNHGDTYTAHHPDHPEWTCTPDGTADDDLVEVKTARYLTGWGEQGTAEIPPYYLTQAAWQMIVTGSRRVWFPILAEMSFAEYVVDWDDIAEDVPLILAWVEDFQRRLRELDPPDADGSDSTYRVLRKLHPDIHDGEVTVSDHLAQGLATALAAEKAAKAEAQRHKSLVLEAMGTARKATTGDGRPVATRTAKAGGVPYLTAARTIHQLAS